MKVFLLATVFIGVSGCTSAHYLWMKHGGTQKEYGETKYKCQQEAQQKEAYVNEHTGVAESSVVTNQDVFAACMNADGWYLRETPPGR